jgi:amino acid adenylation domain-containing protein
MKGTLYPCKLSKNQEQFYYINQLEPGNAAYNIASVFKIKGKIDIRIFTEAIGLILFKYEILRTRVSLINGSFCNTLHSLKAFDNLIQIHCLNCHFEEEKLPQIIDDEINKDFKLEELPLIRVCIFNFLEETSVLTIVMHHITVDLHSKIIFQNDLSLCYNSLLKGKSPALSVVTSQYADFCIWQEKWLKSDEAASLNNDWKIEIEKIEYNQTLPADFSIKRTHYDKGIRKHFLWDKNLSEKILTFSKQNTVSSFTVLLTAYFIFLHKLTNSKIITVGVPLSNRRNELFQSTFGCIMNIVPVTIDLSGTVNSSELLKHVREALLKVHRRQEIPYLKLKELSGNSLLFQTGFTFEPPMELELDGLQVSPLFAERKGSQLDLFLTFWMDTNSQFHYYLEFATELFKISTIERFSNIYANIVAAMINQPQRSVASMDILPVSDIQLLKQWNNTNCPYDKHLSVHRKFEEQVKETPDAPAIITTGITLSYKELNIHANRLANFFIQEGLKTEECIAVCMTRSVEMMIALFAILKAGGVYLPVDPENPEERLNELFNSANPRIILSTKQDSGNIPNKERILFLDNILKDPLSTDKSNPEVEINPQNLAYVIYTSGSTGVPKGVMIEHHSVLNRLGWMQKKYAIKTGDLLILKTPLTFDVSIWELFWWSFYGAGLVILPPREHKSPMNIIHHIQTYKISEIHFVPSMFVSFIETVRLLGCQESISSLKHIFLSGEALPPVVVKDYYALFPTDPAPVLVNLYGPTEATVDVSWYDCTDVKPEKVFIGKPIDNTGLFIVNEENNLQPINVQGELVITGVNLARGYLNKPELTDEKFFLLQLPGADAIRAYRTGDLAKWDSSGNIEYLGRLDNQVKIRGIRIELSEIEVKLSNHIRVQHCAVLTHGVQESTRIIAYVVLKAGPEIMENDIIYFLQAKLPNYMIPSGVVFMDEFPLTSSGKIDRKKLPKAPEFKKAIKNTLKPGSAIEKEIKTICEQLLELPEISILDNFFDIGGNSLLAIRLANILSRKFICIINPLVIFEMPNIKEISQYIEDYRSNRIKLTTFKTEIDKKMEMRLETHQRSRKRRTKD